MSIKKSSKPRADSKRKKNLAPGQGPEFGLKPDGPGLYGPDHEVLFGREIFIFEPGLVLKIKKKKA
jgi:hypothetical protein